MRPDDLVLVGIIGAPRGVKGEVRVKSYTSDPKAIGGLGPLTDEGERRLFAIERLNVLKEDLLAVKLKGVETREAALALNGTELFARRDRLPPPGEEEYYLADLVGLEAVTREGASLGRVKAVVNYGAGDILEIAPATSGETVLLPFTKAVAPVVDVEAGRIVVAPPALIEG
ncbi:MAG: 16S rRNA processing protein RimM [Hyphomicrobiales bacterium]|nr:16S rRNA processing protein RimM [Hyphomicrobiales bacterium]